MDVRHEIELLLRARTPLIAIDSFEETRVRDVLAEVARSMNLRFYRWTVTNGLVLHGAGPVYDSKDPRKAMANIATLGTGVFLMKDLLSYLDQAEVVRAVKDLVLAKGTVIQTLVVTGPDVTLPPALVKHAARLALPLPSSEELEALVWRVVADLSQGLDVQVHLAGSQLQELIDNLKGLTTAEAERAIGRAVVDDLALTVADIDRVREIRREVLEDGGVLELVRSPATLDDVGGLKRLKGWLAKRRRALSPEAKEFGLSPPKGIVLLGVQGCGKSLAAKAVATDWKLPLLRLEPGRLYDKWIGESDKRLDHALQAVEHMAPCVLWIDEIEKGFASAGGEGGDGGLSRRLFGRLLGWLQERTSPVFVVATCNDVQAMPPELLRKGRFDEVFFVDLPTAPDRRAILESHLRQRDRDPLGFDLEQLVGASDGFSGAELEQAIVSALYAAFAETKKLETAHILEELESTRPLSVLRAEDIGALRTWAKERAVPA